MRRGDEWIVRSRKNRDATLHSEDLDLEVSLEAIYALVGPGEDAEPESSVGDS